MGYRSDVRISTTKKGYKELRNFVADYLKNHKRQDGTEYPNLLDMVDIQEENSRQVYLGWNNLKWYDDDFIDVQAIMKGLDYLENHDLSFSYARMGESYGDYDRKFNDGKDIEEGNYLEGPSINWSFDDDYTEYLMHENDKNKDDFEM